LNKRSFPADINAVELVSISKKFDIRFRKGTRFFSLLFGSNEIHAVGESMPEKSNFFYALDDVSLIIKKNTSLGIVGGNGVGKSTLLQIMAGTLKPSGGTLEVKGRVASLLELGSGFDPNFTGRENVVLNASILGLSKNEIENRMETILDFAEIGDFIDRPVKSYSSGMSLRLAFSVIAHVEADILIIDEALAVGDAVFIQKCMKFIRDFKKRGTLILVSHDFAAIQSLCSECIWLAGGKIVSSGKTSEVLNDYHSFVLKERNEQIDAISSINEKNSNSKTENVTIKKVSLANVENGQEISQIKGGENVVFQICVNKNHNLANLVVGFIVRNRLGMDLFSQKVDLANSEDNMPDIENRVVSVAFKFTMPRLAKGVYTIYVAVAQNVSSGDVLHHIWADNSFVFESTNTETFSGLFKVPMKNITFM